MAVEPAKTPCLAGAAWLALGLLTLGGQALAATTPIYKCLDRNLGVLYTDVPCNGGEQLDVRAGDADPAAVARLQRERDALDQSFAQRLADERSYLPPAAGITGMAYEPDDSGGPYEAGPAFGYVYGFGSPYGMHPRTRPRHPKPVPQQPFTPHPPLTAPRR